MSMTNLARIDKFYIVLVATLILMSVIVIVSFRGVFTSFVVAYETKPSQKQLSRIDVSKLEQAINLVYDRDVPAFSNIRGSQTQVLIPNQNPTESVSESRDQI